MDRQACLSSQSNLPTQWANSTGQSNKQRQLKPLWLFLAKPSLVEQNDTYTREVCAQDNPDAQAPLAKNLPQVQALSQQYLVSYLKH